MQEHYQPKIFWQVLIDTVKAKAKLGQLINFIQKHERNLERL